MTVTLPEIARYMRMGRTVPTGTLAARVTELRDAALRAIRPVRIWRRFPIQDSAIVAGTTRLEIGGTLQRHIAGCHTAYLVCGTLGAGFDAFQRRTSVRSGADALIVQAIGAALIEKWMDMTDSAIRAELRADETLRTRYSPGYGTFPLAAQRVLLALLDAPRTVGVALTDNLLMVPSKSVSAVIGVQTERTPED